MKCLHLVSYTWGHVGLRRRFHALPTLQCRSRRHPMNREENKQRRQMGAGLVLVLALMYPGVSMLGSASGLGLDQSAFAGGKGGGGNSGGGGSNRGGGNG